MCYSALVRRNLKHLEVAYGFVPGADSFDHYAIAASADPKRFPPLEDRIYPHHYAPVMHDAGGGRRTIELMRYSVYPPFFARDQRKYDTVFNARCDNLTSPFWSEAFMHHHGFVPLRAFYEWVAVGDLLKAGVVTLDDVKEEFAKQAAERRAKVEAAGKKYKPTPTELKDPRFRQIIIEFHPHQDVGDLLVPVVFSTRKQEDGPTAMGFAIVTSDPPPEISIAGHDRCPVFLQDKATVEEWLHPDGRTAKDMLEVLGRQRRIVFTHELAEVA